MTWRSAVSKNLPPGFVGFVGFVTPGSESEKSSNPSETLDLDSVLSTKKSLKTAFLGKSDNRCKTIQNLQNLPQPEIPRKGGRPSEAPPPSGDALELAEERAAILEYDGGLSREEAERRAGTRPPGGDPRGGVPPGTLKNPSQNAPGATPEGCQGVDDPTPTATAVAPTTPETLPAFSSREEHLAVAVREAGWVAGQLPEDDADRSDLEAFIGAAGSGDDDDLTRLGVRLVEVYARRIDPKYRAAIWGGRTWAEVQGARHG